MLVKYKGYNIDFSEEKNLLLKETRGIGFEDIIEIIRKGNILDDLNHKSKKYPQQRILVLKIEKYTYAFPYIIDLKRKVVFLKTLFPSRDLTAKYIKGGKKK